jgi:heme-degrading monooxygenase HmoA
VNGRVRVLVYARAESGDTEKVVAAYHRVSAELEGTPGLLANELLHSLAESCDFAVLSEWESEEAFLDWERGSAHRGTTAPLRPYQDTRHGRPFGVYRVTARYGAAGRTDGARP